MLTMCLLITTVQMDFLARHFKILGRPNMSDGSGDVGNNPPAPQEDEMDLVRDGNELCEVENDSDVCHNEEQIIFSLKSLLELHDGHSENLSDITKVVNVATEGYNSAAGIHKCVVSAFPDLDAQQSPDNNEIFYLGLRFINPSRFGILMEDKIVKWLKQRFQVDEFGHISCQTIRDLALKEIGFTKQNSIGVYVRKAFPSVYVRRSDRLRWYCGITLPEKEDTDEDRTRKHWLESACSWLRKSMHENVCLKEKCRKVYAALNQFIGKMSIECSMAAVKCVFPGVTRKTIDGNAYYVGIGFVQSTIRESIKETPAKPRGIVSPQPLVNEEEQEIVTWLRKVMAPRSDHREKLLDIVSMMSKKLNVCMNEKNGLRYIRKAFPLIMYRKRDGVAHVTGYEIKPQYTPRDPWKQKSIKWLQEIFVTQSADHCEKLSPILELMKQNLQCIHYRKLNQLLRSAFPHLSIKKSPEGTFAHGVGYRENYLQVDSPAFTAEDFVADFSDVDVERVDDQSEDISMVVSHSTPVTLNSFASPVSPTRASAASHVTTTCSSEKIIKQLEDKVDNLTNVVEKVSTEMSGLREQLAVSCRQKDTLIIQLQQSLMLLTQQQFQRMVKPNQSLNQQDLSQNNPFVNLPTMTLQEQASKENENG